MMALQGQISLWDSFRIRYPNRYPGKDLQNAAYGKKVSQGDRLPAITPKLCWQASGAWARHRPKDNLTQSFSADGQQLLVSSSARSGIRKTPLAKFRLRS